MIKMNRNRVELSELVGKHIIKCTKLDGDEGDELRFYCSDETVYTMFHNQSCCEHVYLEDICGDLEDLNDADVYEFRCDTSDKVDHKDNDECLWTFYNIRTSKGYVTLRWYGSSNGYYSVDVDFYMIKPPTDLFKPYFEGSALNPYETFEYKKGSRFPLGYSVTIIFKNGTETQYTKLNEVLYAEFSDVVTLVYENNVRNYIKTKLIDYMYISAKCPRVN